MRLRLPRPSRGWPEFLDDLVIVMLGVFIALLAQEFIQSIHQRSSYAEARRNVYDEVGGYLLRFQHRLQTQSCINRRLELIQQIVDGGTHGGAIPDPLWIGRPQLWGFGSGRWQGALAAQQYPAFSPAELSELSSLYSSFQEIWEFESDEQRAWARLRALEHVDRLDPILSTELRLALQQARLSNYQLHVAMTQAIDSATELGVKPVGTVHPSLSVCLPLNLTRADALKRLGRTENQEP
jgi:hypothetical protein